MAAYLDAIALYGSILIGCVAIIGFIISRRRP
jgi:hypothetical protein